jgi:FkbM family methyltransferase
MNIIEPLKIPYRWMFRRKKTYSQTGEDIIADFFLADVKNGFYVDVGANDPVYLNNTYLFYKKGWRGLLVEPDRFRCRVLKAARPRDEVLNMGAGLHDSEMTFYVFKPDTFSTFSKTEADHYRQLGYTLVKTMPVPIRPLGEILAAHATDTPIDILSVDTEGYDLEVIQSNDWNRFRPKIVIVEVVRHQGDHGIRQHRDFDAFMEKNAYKKLADTYINCIYIENEYAKALKI